MTKTELKEWVYANNGATTFRDSLLSKIDKLDEPTPDKIPFKWPVSDCYEVVTYEDIEVTGWTDLDQYGVMPGVISGHWYLLDTKGLYLRPKETEMITMWCNYYGDDATAILFPTEEKALSVSPYYRQGNPFPVQFPKPTP